MKIQRKMQKPVVILCILILVSIIICSGLWMLESTAYFRGEPEIPAVSKTVTRETVDYFPRQDITVFLILGIDETGPVKESGSYNNEGEADMVMLLIFDEKAKACDVLYLNRDTMLEMPVLGIGGRKAGTFFGQLALAHTYGSGMEDSCENTREAVSDFLYGTRIDYYAAMNMDAVSILNDAVGGVPVNVKEDFSQVDPSIRKGKMTLLGEQAIHYVRSRKNVGDRLNLSRIDRQREFVTGFMEAFRKKMETAESFAVNAYEKISPYLVTDCSMNAMIGMIERYADYEIREVVMPEGENVQNEYMEFHVDAQALDGLILRLFYAPK